MKKILLGMVVFFVGVYFLLINYFPNIEINKYDSVETVHEQKAIENGWVPKNIPESAYDIVETHDTDSHTIVGKFSYKEKDEVALLTGLKKSNDIYEGEGFLFKINTKENLVDFRNIPLKK